LIKINDLKKSEVDITNYQMTFKNEKDHRKYLIKKIQEEKCVPKSDLKRLSFEELLKINDLTYFEYYDEKNYQITFKKEKDCKKYLINKVRHKTYIPKSILKRLSLNELLRIDDLGEHGLRDEESLVNQYKKIIDIKDTYRNKLAKALTYVGLGLLISFVFSFAPQFILFDIVIGLSLGGVLGSILAGAIGSIIYKKVMNKAIDVYIYKLIKIVVNKEASKIKEVKTEYSDNLESELTCEKKVEASKEKKKTRSSKKKKAEEVEEIEEIAEIDDYNV